MRLGLSALALAAALTTATPGLAQVPGEVQGVGFGTDSTVSWSASAGAGFYNVYRGSITGLRAAVPASCHAHPVAGTTFETPASPASGETFFYLVTAESTAGEGTPGVVTGGTTRSLLGRCTPVVRNHVFDRVGYGWSEWARDRVAALGVDGYIQEQLDPLSISEGDNTELSSRLAAIEPPEDSSQLIARQIVGGVYARRQLAEQMGSFWTNFFNTDNRKVQDYFERQFPEMPGGTPPPQCDPAYPERARKEAALAQDYEFDTFMGLSFGASFRTMLEASAKSPAMIIFLDTVTNVVTAPNENYAREILELYSMGVDGGYTQTDVEQLSRVFTGWSLCKKDPANLNDPLAPCIATYWDPLIPGSFVANFRPTSHDCGAKTLFDGTPQELTLASTCGDSAAMVQELETALDAIASHPSTPRFIASKLLARIVTDLPAESLVDALVTEWNDGSNPAGVGDVREVLRTTLALPEFRDPDRIGSKVKTPLEQFVSGFRAVRGRTSGTGTVFNYLTRAQHLPYMNPVPTGWPEAGGDWIDTNNVLERQNFGIQMASQSNTTFGSDPITMLNANGISTAAGNSAAIVDFFLDALFGGAVTPAERTLALNFLNTDDNGNPANYNNTRIRDTVGFLLGFPQFQEQ